MKKLLCAFYMVLICLSIIACGNTSVGKTDGAVIDVGSSTKFGKEEIEAAIECVKENFKSFGGCNLTALWYDEKKSNAEIKSYMTAGLGAINGVSQDNVIILLSNFTVDSSGGNGNLNPNSTYTDWNWILIRDSRTGKWRVNGSGYGA